MRKLFKILGIGFVLLLGGLALLTTGWFSASPTPGAVTQIVRPNVETSQILFGDLHVHTTFSPDAFMGSLPIAGGEGAHPPADACDYARFCAALDFWSINDHAEAMSPQMWTDIKQSIRSCNAVGDPVAPDTVAFTGFEWTQVGKTPETHYGHQNVIFKDDGEQAVATRPIAARGSIASTGQETELHTPIQGLGFPAAMAASGVLLGMTGDVGFVSDMMRRNADLNGLKGCDADTPWAELPADCFETAADPAELIARLKAQGHSPLIIPHGSTWGAYTPPGTRFDKHLDKGNHVPDQHRLIEVFSGHGNSERFRPFQAAGVDGTCPAPTGIYTPTCWRAGEIIAERCVAEGLSAEICEARAAQARSYAVAAGAAMHNVVSGAAVADWLDSGQCTDCFLPAFNYRPMNSVQYALAASRFAADGKAQRMRFGLIGSSDNHTGRPGAGFKQSKRVNVTDSRVFGASGPQAAAIYEKQPITSEPVEVSLTSGNIGLLEVSEVERGASFFYTGGIVGAHAQSRDRDAIWQALNDRHVFGTSGPRMMLWFDVMNAPQGAAPMGSHLAMGQAPTFRVKALGAQKQKPGCPAFVEGALGPERAQSLCRGECFNPSDERMAITAIEVVRIRPQAHEGEEIAGLIDDPWKRFDCAGDGTGCEVTFTDDNFTAMGRDALYYVRALQAEEPVMNAGNLRCTYDAEGNCIAVNPCHGDPRTDPADDCTQKAAHRAWSSPIFVDFAPADILAENGAPGVN
ncbi:MAG: DUF3604 domain-containing protein [Alphaproteobacteria bacterium]